MVSLKREKNKISVYINGDLIEEIPNFCTDIEQDFIDDLICELEEEGIIVT